ncbi:hypothetical protein E3P99_03293 [Wallemia hederae]|uniref:Hydrophobin n=1 Tax=Wallemia hederae TaxID=1540922 RepID=A0A4T0FGS3_9BASI|nr:hypothetical protein E3P99_03293 [Wallemia hederae]
MIAQTVFAAALIASVSASWESKTGSCNTGTISCCDLNKKAQSSTGKNDALISTGDIASQVGVQCDQVPLLIGVAIEDECKNTPVCCEGLEEDGLVGLALQTEQDAAGADSRANDELKHSAANNIGKRKLEQGEVDEVDNSEQCKSHERMTLSFKDWAAPSPILGVAGVEPSENTSLFLGGYEDDTLNAAQKAEGVDDVIEAVGAHRFVGITSDSSPSSVSAANDLRQLHPHLLVMADPSRAIDNIYGYLTEILGLVEPIRYMHKVVAFIKNHSLLLNRFNTSWHNREHGDPPQLKLHGTYNFLDSLRMVKSFKAFDLTDVLTSEPTDAKGAEYKSVLEDDHFRKRWAFMRDALAEPFLEAHEKFQRHDLRLDTVQVELAQLMTKVYTRLVNWEEANATMLRQVLHVFDTCGRKYLDSTSATIRIRDGEDEKLYALTVLALFLNPRTNLDTFRYRKSQKSQPLLQLIRESKHGVNIEEMHALMHKASNQIVRIILILDRYWTRLLELQDKLLGKGIRYGPQNESVNTDRFVIEVLRWAASDSPYDDKVSRAGTDPVAYWESKNDSWIKFIAIQLLSARPTSAPCERLFASAASAASATSAASDLEDSPKSPPQPSKLFKAMSTSQRQKAHKKVKTDVEESAGECTDFAEAMSCSADQSVDEDVAGALHTNKLQALYAEEGLINFDGLTDSSITQDIEKDLTEHCRSLFNACKYSEIWIATDQ